ncbi:MULTISPECIES: anti-sigma F factor antagonist [Paenibacillus]|uniref:Anti-sigma F factor antagonist n=1 Tax=Paenibacillus campinasensis TaxID=66347 RepID=A0A268F2S2_9BACL|nr:MULTISPECIES: anti-sigma F factor antagonist [Paenibacillus]MUG64942.1 anti-sigma F factor antagonist [Paenibacillus campinasensis]PAD79661.1 anti-sigma F factor antagonist [Paenibacillus campinasensis]PAK53524.1 anti-sigma F factor antagonist [Paenibacillus sp. 7541]
MNLHVDMEHHRHVLIVRLSGELDHHTADHVRIMLDDAITKRQTEHLVMSLKNLEFMDSSGLGVILGRYKSIKHKGGKMALCDVKPQVYRLLEMSGLFKIMPIYENEGTALSGLEVVS